jgi:acyl-CoA thioester hydrolase
MTDLPTHGRFDGLTHLLPVRVYYEDTDFTGLVYHANYVRFFERGRSDFLRTAGVGHAELLDAEPPLAFVVSKMTLAFLKPARIDDALLVKTVYRDVRGPRLWVDQAIEREGEVLCRAEVEVACIRLDGRPARPCRALWDKVRPWLASPGSAR